MSKIQIMDEVLANKIAAGEVVEKCMNVVKELVENAIDAKASEIKIELIDSGVKEIRVTDDGIGMEWVLHNLDTKIPNRMVSRATHHRQPAVPETYGFSNSDKWNHFCCQR